MLRKSAGFLLLLLIGQQLKLQCQNYDRYWETVDSLQLKKGLTKDAVIWVDLIYALAKKNRNTAQRIKAILYKINLEDQYREDALLNGIGWIEKERRDAPPVLAALLTSYQAQLYYTYALQRPYNPSDINPKKGPIANWSRAQFREKIFSCHLSSLRNENILQQTSLESLNAIILKGNVRHLRPTLFDLLSHRALEFLQTDPLSVAEPIHPFEMNRETFFLPLKDFIRLPLPTPDSASFKWQCLKLYQRLLRFHLQDTNPEARVDADLERLRYVYDQTAFEHKDSLYFRSLQHISTTYGSHRVTDQVHFLEAEWYHSHYKEQLPDTYPLLTKASHICEEVLQRKDSSEGKENCRRLLEELKEKKLSLTAEKVNLPGQPFRVLVSYKNITSVQIRVIPISEQQRETYFIRGGSPDALRRELVATTPLREYQQNLPEDLDLREHQVEIGIDGLPRGFYAVMAGLRSDFADSFNSISVLPLHVSSLSWINVNEHHYALHRETGKPLPDATADIWYLEEANPGETSSWIKGPRFTADSLGHFTTGLAEQEEHYRPIRVDLQWQGERLFTEESFLTAPIAFNSFTPQPSYRSFLFTDRSIYRPGQLLRFKGMVVRSTGNERHELSTAFNGKLYLNDANGSRIDSFGYTTSTYGTYEGSFRLPSKKISGYFSLQDATGNGYLQFSVEEYKRPKFHVTLLEPDSAFHLNDTVTVKGEALAFGGFGIGKARVAYRVMRKTFYSVWPNGSVTYRYRPMPTASEREIANGITTTGERGTFSIRFPALADGTVKREEGAVYYFEVQADVTDLNGETQQAEHTYPFAFQRFFLRIDMPAELPADSLRKMSVRAEDLYGNTLRKKFTLQLIPLLQPERISRERYWQAPDRFLFDEKTYHRKFPLDIYDRENDPQHWKKAAALFNMEDSTAADGKWNHLIGATPGWYLITATATDEDGMIISSEKVVQLTQGGNTDRPGFYLSLAADASEYGVPGDAHYTINTNQDSLWTIRIIGRIKEPLQLYTGMLPENKVTYRAGITEKDYGGLIAGVASVRHNRFYAAAQTLQVPFLHKQLDIHFSSFRDKTEPGSTETWSLTVRGKNKQAVPAEVLTSMYDAALNKIRPHNWILPSLWNSMPLMPNLSNDRSFFSKGSADHIETPILSAGAYKNYDRLNEFLEQPMSEMFYLRTQTALPGNAPLEPMLPAKTSDPSLPNNTANNAAITLPPKIAQATPATEIRKNFEETAFFLPSLNTDSNGVVTFLFTLPQSITRWKWMTLAHTRDLALGYAEKEIVARKTLMLTANPPRFFREGDRMDYPVKITNLSDQELTGQIQLELIDPETQEPVDGWFRNFFPNQYFTVPPNGNALASFSIEIPFQYHRPVIARAIAHTQQYSDGEAYTIPVLTKRILVTESLALQSTQNGTQHFSFDKLKAAAASESIESHSLTIAFTPDPTWMVIEALPYLMENERENSEQLLRGFYANAIAGWLIKKNTAVSEVIKKWQRYPEQSMMSELEKDAELKSVLIEETPWVLDARQETERRKKLVKALDTKQVLEAQQKTMEQLAALQHPQGGFPWFKGGPADRFITQNILIGLGRLSAMGVIDTKTPLLQSMIEKALRYLDEEVNKDHKQLLRVAADTLKTLPSPLQVQYLYMSSYFPHHTVEAQYRRAFEYYYRQSGKYWLRLNKLLQAMVALTCHRRGDEATARGIIRSLEQQAMTTDAYGNYWKEYLQSGYYWYAVPIASHTLLMEAFSEIGDHAEFLRGLKTWLLLQKQTQHWPDQSSTADACYILLKGMRSSGSGPRVALQLGSKLTVSNDKDAPNEPFKTIIEGRKVMPEMGDIKVTFQSDSGSDPSLYWGAVHWQYFDDLSSTTAAQGPLKLSKTLYRKENSTKGTKWVPVEDGRVLHTGDQIKVRLEIRSDRFLEYVHLKDMRASCFEPVEQLSGYAWQGGIAYYQTGKDASAHYYIPALPKGDYIIEYPLFVTHTGTFSGGIASIGSLYAPAFGSHTEGQKIVVE